MKTAISKRILCVALAMVLCFAVIGAHVVTPAKAAGSQTYEKVTSAPDDWSGKYLIVYEDGGLAFDGSRTTLDAASNTVKVTISDGKITGDFDNNTFTIAKSGDNYTIKSASGYYIGNTSNTNALSASNSTEYTNKISLNASEKTVDIISSGGAYLRYNAASNQLRFRYYKSSSYTGQKAISLYKYVESGSSDIDTSNLKITWDQCKLYLGEMPEIRYTLKVENLDECPITDYGYQVWAKGNEDRPGEPTAEPVSYNFATNGYITTGGMNAYEIANRQWIRAYVIVDGQYIYSDAIEYSIYTYVNYVLNELNPETTPVYGGYNTSELQATVKAFKEYGEAYATMWANKIG